MKPLLDTLQAGTGYLEKHGIEEARLNMEHLLAHVLGCRRLELYLRFDEPLCDDDLETLRAMVKRRGEGEPLQHLLGTVEFCDARFVCDQRALIPRPETEQLVELLLERFGTAPPRRILDVGTGSGCIGLSLANSWRGSAETAPSFVLADISEQALELARMNASRLGLDEVVRLVRSDLFERIDGAFDLIVANLPYIPRGEIPTLSREVRRDPVIALDGGRDGTEIIARLVAEARDRLNAGGCIALEVGHGQAGRIAELCAAADLADIEVLPDLAGIERFLLARQSSPTN